jgi:DNA-binding response OmpR family regulator
MNGSILIIEDVAELADITRRYLEREGFSVYTVDNAEDALAVLDKSPCHLIILDINLPGMDGFEFLSIYRKKQDTPVLIVSARTAEEDQITGLISGADEYITKPFSPRVLTARVRAMFRRIQTDEKKSVETNKTEIKNTGYHFGSFTLDTDTCELKNGKAMVTLTAKEYAVLAYLAETSPRPSTPELIYQKVWNGIYGDLVTVAVHIQRLRKKIETDTSHPEFIQTVRGFGYKLVLNHEN